MAIIAKSTSDFKPAPEGQHCAVCCDVVDLGMKKTTWNGNEKEQHKIRVCFQTDKINPDDNKPYLVVQQFTLSMHQSSHLRKFLESWRGRPYTEEEAQDGVDVEKMVGVNAFMQIIHTTRNGSTYANIDSIMKAPAESTPLKVRDYIRVKDREDESNNGGSSDDQPPIGNPPEDGYLEGEDDDLPF